MSTLTDDEGRELAMSIRAACERHADEDRVRAVAFEGDGVDREFWTVLCEQVGVAAIAVPEDLGGVGYGYSELGIAAHELGRSLAPVPFLSSVVMAISLVVDAGDETTIREVLPALMDGSRTAAVALTGTGGAWNRADVTLAAETADSEHWTISGDARHVIGATGADDLFVVAATGAGPAVFHIDATGPTASGLTVTPENVLDSTRPMASLSFDSTPARHILGDGPIDECLSRLVARTIAVLAAEQVGACERVLEIATKYSQTREQFGRPIGSFQAIKHRCADILVDLEWSRSAAQAALTAADAAGTDIASELGWRSSMAKAVCSEALRSATIANIQIHGGIGFTWEDPGHLYFKRARTDEVMFGGIGYHWDNLAVEAKLL